VSFTFQAQKNKLNEIIKIKENILIHLNNTLTFLNRVLATTVQPSFNVPQFKVFSPLTSISLIVNQ
jgi:hypothetical protein